MVTNQIGKMVGNVKGALGNMEFEAIRRAVPRLKKIKFRGYNHDKDNKTKKLFQTIGKN